MTDREDDDSGAGGQTPQTYRAVVAARSEATAVGAHTEGPYPPVMAGEYRENDRGGDQYRCVDVSLFVGVVAVVIVAAFATAPWTSVVIAMVPPYKNLLYNGLEGGMRMTYSLAGIGGSTSMRLLERGCLSHTLLSWEPEYSSLPSVLHAKHRTLSTCPVRG